MHPFTTVKYSTARYSTVQSLASQWRKTCQVQPSQGQAETLMDMGFYQPRKFSLPRYTRYSTHLLFPPQVLIPTATKTAVATSTFLTSNLLFLLLSLASILFSFFGIRLGRALPTTRTRT